METKSGFCGVETEFLSRAYTVCSCVCAWYPEGFCTNWDQWKGKGKLHPCTGTEVLYRPYDP